MCRVAELRTGEKACVYTLDEVKLVFKADSELVMLRGATVLQLQQVDQLKLAITHGEQRVQDLTSISLRLQGRVDDLTRERLACDRDLQAERAKPRFGSPLAWAVAGVATAFAAGAVVALVLR